VCTSLAPTQRKGWACRADSDDPGRGTPRVYSLALVLAHSDGPGPGTPRVSKLALAFAEAMGRFNVLAAANSSAATGKRQRPTRERTAICLSATHGRVAQSFEELGQEEYPRPLSETVSLCQRLGGKDVFLWEGRRWYLAHNEEPYRYLCVPEKKT